MANYETIIGIEVHAELNTKRKIFSPSLNDINAKPNTNVHPIDLALPGTLPRFNEEVLKKALIVCNALNLDITKHMHWDRKNYFYADNPKGFQITQQQTPIGRNGKIILDNKKEITIDFMHMEEDTAKSFHSGVDTLLDFNRCGVPLIEIVTKPDMRNAAEAKEYLEKLREILLYVDASDGKLEEGSFRVDVNVSVRPYGQKGLNTKVEIKNLNSFQNVVKAIEMEQKAQIMAYNTNQEVLQATKRFNEDKKRLDIMRIKETVEDYRYMPEPDLPDLHLTDEYINDAIKDMAITPDKIRNKLLKDFSFDEKSTNILMADKEMTMFLLESVEAGLNSKQMLNYLIVNTNEYMNKQKVNFTDLYINIEQFSSLEKMLADGVISTNHVKKIIPTMYDQKLSVNEVVEKLGLKQIVDVDILRGFVQEAIDKNPESIVDYNNGKDRAFGFLIGQIMKISKGQANPTMINKILKEMLEENK